jgi:hypothetical protein
MKQFAFARIKP